MAEIDVRTQVLVKDIMSSPVITVDENASIRDVAQLMGRHNIECVIVTGRSGKPLGVITEKDLVARVLSRDVVPSKLNAKEVMTSPLITVDPDETLSGAARRMSRLNIRRLGVMYKGNLVGIVSSRDILAITPELIEIIREKARIEVATVEEAPEHPPLAGYCDQCGQWSDTLREAEGNFLCEECRIERETEY